METMDVIEPTQHLMNVKTFNSQEEFLDNIKSIPYISGGLDDLANSQTAIIYFNAASCRPKCVLPCSSLFNCNFSSSKQTFILWMSTTTKTIYIIKFSFLKRIA